MRRPRRQPSSSSAAASEPCRGDVHATMMAPSPPRQAPSADPPQATTIREDNIQEILPPPPRPMEHSPRPRRRPRRQLSSTPAAAREPRRRPVRGAPPIAPSPPPGAPSADPPAAAETTIHEVPEDIMRKILLRLHSSLSLACAMRVCRLWDGIASKPGFRKRFRETHPSSPLIGLVTNDDEDPYVLRPTVHRIHERGRDMRAIIQNGDLFLDDLESASDARWRIQDSRNGVLLLCQDDDNSLCVHNLVSGRQPVRIQDRPDDVTTDGGEFVAHCLLDGTVQQCVAVDSFRVVSVQQCRRKIRAMEYDSSTGEWRCRRCHTLPPDGFQPIWRQRPMYAAGHIFWEYAQWPAESFSMFVLDTRTMEFSARLFPKKGKRKDPKHGYSIGEIEDGKGYLVCLRGLSGENYNPRLQVWSINADNNMLELDLNKEVPMSQLAIPPNMSSNVYTVINGLAVVTSHTGPHFVVDLHKETLLATFSKKLSGQGYLYQLSWPHAISSGSTPPLEDNNIGTSNEVAPCENHHTLKSPDTPQDDGPRERKKRQMIYANNGLLLAYKKMKKMKRSFISITSNRCLGETTSCDPLVVESDIVSTTAVPQNSPRVPCRDILVGQQATSQDKPLSEDVLNCPQRSGSPKKSRHKEVETTSTPAVRPTNQEARCRNSSMGRPARHEKPVCKRTRFVTHVKKDIHEKSSLHVEAGTETEETYKCNFKGCRSTFVHKSSRSRHLREVHGQGECIQYTCEVCHETFARNYLLKGHVEEKHNPRVQYTCKIKTHDTHYRRKHNKTSASRGEPGRPRKEKTLQALYEPGRPRKEKTLQALYAFV